MTANGATAPEDDLPPGARRARWDYQRPSTELLRRFAELPTANIADAMGRFGALDPAIRPVWPGARFVGTALTVWTRAGDNLGIHRAIPHAQPGDVLVVNGGGDTSRALIGELVGARAQARGVVAFVLDGAARDASDLAEIGMPAFARSCTAAGPFKKGPFANAVEVAVGGVVVKPGDIVAGDGDGVVVVPLAEAELVLARAVAKHEAEAVTREQIAAGTATPAGGDQ